MKTARHQDSSTPFSSTFGQHALLLALGSRVRAVILALLLYLLAACGSTPVREDVPPFRLGAATANQQTSQAFADINSFLRQRQVDRAVQKATLSEALFFAALADADIARWNRAFSVIDAYAASLEELLNPQRRSGAQQDLVGLGASIEQLTGSDLPDGVAAAFATLGGLLLQLKTERDALAAIRIADPGMQAVFGSMMAAIGESQDVGIRSTVRTSWNQVLAEGSLEFLRAPNAAAKRLVTNDFVTTLSKRDAQDHSLAALRRSIGLLASAHAALAAGRSGGAEAMLDLVQREYAAWRTQREALENAAIEAQRAANTTGASS